MKKIKEKKVVVTVRRPNGNVENIDITKKVLGSEKWFLDHLYPRLCSSTANAGRGTVVSYSYQDEEYEKEEKDSVGECRRCGKKIDKREAFCQREWTRLGSQAVQVDVHYCRSCKSLLSSIGAGEKTELVACEGITSQELANKED